MFNRRFLRIKVFHQLYSYWQDETHNLPLHEKNLLKSLDKTYQLYIYLLAMPAEFRFFIEKDLDIQQSKHFPQENLISQLKAFAQNKAILQLEKSELLQSKLKHYKLKWDGQKDLFKQIWPAIKANATFQEYANKSTPNFNDDKKMLNEFFQVCVADFDVFDHYMEERFMNWEDDQTLAVLTLLKTIDQLTEGKPDSGIIADYADDNEGQKFMKELFTQSIADNEELTKLIAAKTQNWEADRIAMVDLLLMKMALCEILKFPYIPVKVSINEYLELAKLYSTPNSHGFINGILDKVQIDLRKENKINKVGRGLVE